MKLPAALPHCQKVNASVANVYHRLHLHLLCILTSSPQAQYHLTTWFQTNEAPSCSLLSPPSRANSFFFLFLFFLQQYFFSLLAIPSHATTIASRSSSEPQALQSGRCRRRMTRCKAGKSPLKGFLAGCYRRCKVLWLGQLFCSQPLLRLLVALFSVSHLSCFSLTKLLFLHPPHFLFLSHITV